MERIERIAVVGAGRMGCAIAQIFAEKGKSVTLYDSNRSLDAMKTLSDNAELLIKYGVYDAEQKRRAVANTKYTASLKDAVSDADMVIECVFEELELKREVFEKTEALCRRDAILATNTSVMSVAEISERLAGRERFLGTHFWNPAYMIPLVELVKTEYVSDDVVNAVYGLLEEAGKKPVICEKDVPGFIANRLQHALWREAISIVENGIADAKTVDTAVKYGPGLRWPQLGPLENADMVGLDLTLSIHDYVLGYLEDSHEPSPLLKEKVQKGELGFKTGGRGFYELEKSDIEKINEGLIEYLAKVTAGR